MDQNNFNIEIDNNKDHLLIRKIPIYNAFDIVVKSLKDLERNDIQRFKNNREKFIKDNKKKYENKEVELKKEIKGNKNQEVK